MIDSKSHMDRVVVAFTAPNPEGTNFIGHVVGMYDCPTAIIEIEPGRHATWAQHLCRPATRDEAETYWRGRALAAEKKLQEVG